MFYISLLITLSAIGFVNRISLFFIRKMPVSQKLMTKIGTFYLFFSFVILVLYFDRPFTLFVIVFLANLVSPSAFFIFLNYRQRQFQSEFVRFLGVLILKMKMGEGFRSAYGAALGLDRWKYTLVLQELFDNVVFSPQKPPLKGGKIDQFLVSCFEVLKRVDDNPGSALMQLNEFRKHLILLHRFRRRSGQIWHQILMQALVISALYLLLLTYMTVNFGLRNHYKIVILSMSCFIAGSISLWQMRKVKPWKL